MKVFYFNKYFYRFKDLRNNYVIFKLEILWDVLIISSYI